jgi:hypothetical protein
MKYRIRRAIELKERDPGRYRVGMNMLIRKWGITQHEKCHKNVSMIDESFV